MCAASDLCGAIALRDGENISIYAEAALGCELPTLHIVRRRGNALLLSYELPLKGSAERRQAAPGERPASYSCRTATGYVSFDKGRVRMAVFPLPTDGQFFVRFAAGTSLERTNATPAIVTAR